MACMNTLKHTFQTFDTNTIPRDKIWDRCCQKKYDGTNHKVNIWCKMNWVWFQTWTVAVIRNNNFPAQTHQLIGNQLTVFLSSKFRKVKLLEVLLTFQ